MAEGSWHPICAVCVVMGTASYGTILEFLPSPCVDWCLVCMFNKRTLLARITAIGWQQRSFWGALEVSAVSVICALGKRKHTLLLCFSTQLLRE